MLIPLSCNIDQSRSVDQSDRSVQKVEEAKMYNHLTVDSYVRDLVDHPAFKGFGELLLPRDNNSAYYGAPLQQVGSLTPYHSHVEPEIVVGALNHMIDEVNDGNRIFYDFYTGEQKQQDPRKSNTGLFYFRGKLGAPNDSIYFCLTVIDKELESNYSDYKKYE